MDSTAYPMLYVYAFLIALSLGMTILLYLRWKERKREANRLITRTFFVFFLTVVILYIGFLEMYLTGFKKEIYQYSLGFSYASLSIANIYLTYFIAEAFGILPKFVKKYNFISIIIAILVLLPWNAYGVPAAETQYPQFRLITNILLIVWSSLIYTRIANACFNNMKKADNIIAKTGFRLIGWSQITLAQFLIFQALDTLYFKLMNLEGYTIFNYIAWAFCSLFFILCYLGFIMPNWLKQKIMVQEPSKNELAKPTIQNT